MKKRISVLIAALLMLSMCVVPVSADSAEVRVYIDAPAQVTAGEMVAVSLYVNGSIPAGGVKGTIRYKTTDLQYANVALRSDVTALGNTEDVAVRVNGEVGQINFVLLSNVAGGTAPADAWLTVNFTMTSTAADTVAEVTLSDVAVSNMDGTVALTPTVITNDTVRIVAESNQFLSMAGATIRTSLVNQGIRFCSTKLAALGDVIPVEAGVVMMPTALLYEGQDLTKETVGKGGTAPAIASVTDAASLQAVAGGEPLYATLTNGLTDGRANVEITARSYVVIGDQTIYYSHNTDAEKHITTGEAEKSLASVAQAIAATEIANASAEGKDINTLGDLLTTSAVLTNDQVTQLLTFCVEHYAYLA